ncbi:GTP pyrophosphokinase family protein [Bacillus sp. RC97]|uniref:GTP pyrophosphokinase n=1 Tax=Bacillus sp. RC97 TaxID=3156294 RepID=UPI0038516D45
MKFEISEREYREHCEKYSDLGVNLQNALTLLLKEADITCLDVNYRIKDYDSFLDKIDRKGYQNPLEENEDFCGMRIICYFPNDIKKIVEVIKREFNVHHHEDKSDKEIDRFGYRSYHFVVSIKEEWLSSPNFRNLRNVKAEIQVRTILMHAWADIEHKLQYKKKEHIPKVIQRKFYQLSALFELADEQFEMLRNKKEEIYINSLSKRLVDFDIKQEMNADTLQAFLDLNCGDRRKKETFTIGLLDELIKDKITFDDLVSAFKKFSEGEIEEIEREMYGPMYDEGKRWAQVGLVRVLLQLVNNEYWNEKKKELSEKGLKQREGLREQYKNKR